MNALPYALTIVIPYVGVPRRLEACLNSIASQDPRQLCLVLVVDNGAREPVPFVTALGERLSVLTLETNVGFARAVNEGSKHVTTDLMLVLNDDAVLVSDCASELLAASQLNTGFDIFALRVLSAHGAALQSAGLMFSRSGFGNRSNRHLFEGVNDYVEIFGPCGAAAAFKTSVFRRLGGFNEAFFFMYEDVEFALRANLVGHRCLYVPGATVFHAKGGTIQSNWSLKVREGLRNSLYTVVTCLPTRFLLKHGRPIASFYTWLIGTLIREGFAREALLALLRLVVEVPRLYGRRRIVLRSVSHDLERVESLLYDGEIEIEVPRGFRRYRPRPVGRRFHGANFV